MLHSYPSFLSMLFFIIYFVIDEIKNDLCCVNLRKIYHFFLILIHDFVLAQFYLLCTSPKNIMDVLWFLPSYFTLVRKNAKHYETLCVGVVSLCCFEHPFLSILLSSRICCLLALFWLLKALTATRWVAWRSCRSYSLNF